MSPFLTKKALLSYRRRLWRLDHDSRLKTIEQITDFLDEVGMCLLFACGDIPLPKIYECAADDSDWWAWKDRLQQRKRAYNGRLVRRKATLVSIRLLPAFYACYLTGGGHIMYEEEYYWGKLGDLANRVAEYLDRNGPTPVDVLRKAIVSPGKKNTRNFHSALFELQSKFKIVVTGLKERSWGVRVLDLFVNWVPSATEREAESMSRSDAIERICVSLVDTAGAVPESSLSRMLGWLPAETQTAVDHLEDCGKLLRARFRGDQRPWVASVRI